MHFKRAAPKVDISRIQGNGHNALDFHVAFHLGELRNARPESDIPHHLRKDTGFEPLIAHLRSKGIDVQRSSTLAGVVPVADDVIEAVVQHLARRGAARPGRAKTLANTIHTFLGKTLDNWQVLAVIETLKRRAVLSMKDGKVTYSLFR